LTLGTSYDFERQRCYTRFALRPGLNAFHWEDVEKSADQMLANLNSAGAQPVIIDLTPLDYLGSAQLALLVRLWKAIRERQGQMVVEVTAPVVREVMKTAGLHTLWQFTESRVDSFRALGLQDDGRPKLSLIWPTVGLVALVGAAVGLYVSLAHSDLLDGRDSLYVQLGLSAVAVVTGTWTAIRGAGARHGLGIGMAVAGAILAVVELIRQPG
jgi:anti-anti-sigma factor